MQSTTTVTNLVPPQSEPSSPQVLRLRNENQTEDAQPVRFEIQPVIERLRVIYLQHMNRTDELSQLIQDVADRFIRIDCSKINQLSEIKRIAQDCRNQFAKILCSDFDLANLETQSDFNRALLEKPMELRGWKFEEWQIKDFIKLDKFFGQIIEQRTVVLSPFDGKEIPEELPKHEYAQAIVELLKTIPDLPQEVIPPLIPPMQQALVANQIGQGILMALAPRGNGVYKLSSQDAESHTLEKDWMVAYHRWGHYKKMANAAVQLKKNEARLVQLEIDIAARKLANESYLQEIINQEAQRLQAYFEERQQVIQAHLEEFEQMGVEIANLKTKLDETTGNLKKLRTDLSVQEKKSESLQQQIYVEQAKYARLAQEIQEIRNRCKKRPWWKFW